MAWSEPWPGVWLNDQTGEYRNQADNPDVGGPAPVGPAPGQVAMQNAAGETFYADPNDFSGILAQLYGGGATPDQAYQQYVVNEANKGDDTGGFSIGSLLGGFGQVAANTAQIWGPALGVAGLQGAGALVADGVGGYTLGGASSAIPGSTGQLLADNSLPWGAVSDTATSGGASAGPIGLGDAPWYQGAAGTGLASGAVGVGASSVLGGGQGLDASGYGAGTSSAGGAAGLQATGVTASGSAANAAAGIGGATLGGGLVNAAVGGAAQGVGSAAGGTALGSAGTAATTGAASAGSAAALQRILGGTATAADYGSVLGAAAPGLLGAYASDQQTQAYRDLAQQQIGFGAPSRARYEASMQQGFDPASIPGYQAAVDNAMQAQLRKLSTSGNPFGQPGGLIEANKAVIAGTALPAIQQYQNLNSSAGGLNTMAGAANNSAASAIGSNANTWNSLGSAAASVTAPPAFNLQDYFKNLSGNNYALA